MTISDKLDNQLTKVDLLLNETKELEKRQRANRRSHFQKGALITSLRATSYVMIYNSIESSMRAVLKSIRETIEEEHLSFDQAHAFWRLDIVQCRFLERMRSGTNHGNVLVEFVPLTNEKIRWDDKAKERLPFSGNFGQTAALRLKDSLDLVWQAPSGTLGGVDLENIRLRRNALAHGLETFEEVGSEVMADDVIVTLKRTKKFMISYIQALEDYRDKRQFFKPQQESPEKLVSLARILDSSAEEQLRTDE